MKFGNFEIPPKKRGTNKDDTHEKENNWLESFYVKNDFEKVTYPRPFIIQMNGDQYGLLEEDGLYLTNPEDFNIVKNTFHNYELIVKQLDNHFDPIYVDHMREVLNKITQIKENSKKVDPFLLLGSNYEMKNNPEYLYNEFKSYLNIIEEDNRHKIEEFFSIGLDQLSLKEQFYFFNFIKDLKMNEAKTTKEFTDKFKIDGLRTFLSIEQGGKEMGDKILTLGEKLPEESARVLFAKYGEIIDEVENIGGYIERSMKGKVSPLIIEKAKENLLIKGKDLLNSYAVKAGICKGEECVDIGKELEEKLSNIKASLILFASACKSLSENGSLSLEDLANTQLEIVRGSMDEKTQEEMKRIFKENRPNYSKPLLDDVSSEFENNLKNTKDNQTFYILKNNGDITSFMRLDEEKDGSVYGASFNVRTELRGSTIGSELLKEIIEKESITRPFKIICYEKNPMLEKYQSNFGFEIVGTIENYHGTGEKFYEMVRNPRFKQ